MHWITAVCMQTYNIHTYQQGNTICGHNVPTTFGIRLQSTWNGNHNYTYMPTSKTRCKYNFLFSKHSAVLWYCIQAFIQNLKYTTLLHKTYIFIQYEVWISHHCVWLWHQLRNRLMFLKEFLKLFISDDKCSGISPSLRTNVLTFDKQALEDLHVVLREFQR